MQEQWIITETFSTPHKLHVQVSLLPRDRATKITMVISAWNMAYDFDMMEDEVILQEQLTQLFFKYMSIDNAEVIAIQIYDFMKGLRW